MGEPEIDDGVQVKIEGDNNNNEKEEQKNNQKENNENCQKQNNSTLSTVDQKAGGSACSAVLTEDADSQATTTNLDESVDSEIGGHEPGYFYNELKELFIF